MKFLTEMKNEGVQWFSKLDQNWVRLAILITLLTLFVLAAGAPDDGNAIFTG